jgi:hypothetical protein
VATSDESEPGVTQCRSAGDYVDKASELLKLKQIYDLFKTRPPFV